MSQLSVILLDRLLLVGRNRIVTVSEQGLRLPMWEEFFKNLLFRNVCVSIRAFKEFF